MHNAPSVSYPVGRSRFCGVLLAALWLAGAALVGDVQLTGPGRTGGEFRVTISDAPVPATVDADGEVVRGD